MLHSALDLHQLLIVVSFERRFCRGNGDTRPELTEMHAMDPSFLFLAGSSDMYPHRPGGRHAGGGLPICDCYKREHISGAIFCFSL